MSSKYTCTSKIVYYHKQFAQLRADELNFDHGFEKFFIYKCNHCKFYHLTTHPK